MQRPSGASVRGGPHTDRGLSQRVFFSQTLERYWCILSTSQAALMNGRCICNALFCADGMNALRSPRVLGSPLRHRFRDLRPPVAWRTVNTAMVAGNRQVGWPYPQCRVDMEQNPGV